jgi:hypothetical protein
LIAFRHVATSDSRATRSSAPPSCAACANVQRVAGQFVARRDADHAIVEPKKARCGHVVRDDRAGGCSGLDEREQQAVRVVHLRFVPLGSASDTRGIKTRKQTQHRVAIHHAACRELACGIEPVVAITPDRVAALQRSQAAVDRFQAVE